MIRRMIPLFGLLALIGLGAVVIHPTSAESASRYFPETQHWVKGAFLQYWNSHGSLAQQGYPITEEFPEKSTLDGVTRTVQYFQRAVFELHPENAGGPYEVELAQLGVYELQRHYPNGQPAAAPVQGPTGNNPPFFEDRTSAVGLLQSYYNAINRKEYQRAYGYWESHDANGSGPYNQFVQGYADTQAVMLLTGNVTGEGAAGSVYSSVPTVLIATHTDNSTHTFYGCYVTRHTNPGIDPNPAAALERIYSATIKVAPANMSTATMLAQGCTP